MHRWDADVTGQLTAYVAGVLANHLTRQHAYTRMNPIAPEQGEECITVGTTLDVTLKQRPINLS